MNTLKNPTLIQNGPKGKSATPLFLIHDGCGIIFNYFMLKPLRRAVWGIYNPRFESGRTWDGGIPELASEYIGIIKSAVPAGNVLIGGWSFGGLIALEIARQLAKDASSPLRVQGLVLIDSVYPRPVYDPGLEIRQYKGFVAENTPTSLRMKLEKSMINARLMIKSWDPPSWNQFEDAGSALPLSESDDSASDTSAPDRAVCNSCPPPAVLIRARKSIADEEQSFVYETDVARHREMLGWEEHGTKFIHSVLHVEGHHYSVFEASNIDSLDTQLAVACRILDPRL